MLSCFVVGRLALAVDVVWVGDFTSTILDRLDCMKFAHGELRGISVEKCDIVSLGNRTRINDAVVSVVAKEFR